MPDKDAIAVLKDDHTNIKKHLEELESTTDRGAKRRSQLLRTIKTLLETHTTLEEEIFYPAFQKAARAKEDQKMYFEALEEHNAAKLVLADLERAEIATPSFGGKAKVLKELVLHHAKEEERDMFPAARKHLSKTCCGPVFAFCSPHENSNFSRSRRPHRRLRIPSTRTGEPAVIPVHEYER